MSTSSVSSTRLRDLSRVKLKMPINSWKDEIKKAQIKIKELKIAIEVFAELERVGEPWPGTVARLQTTQSTDHKSEPATQC
jgi:hypothetical protein